MLFIVARNSHVTGGVPLITLGGTIRAPARILHFTCSHWHTRAACTGFTYLPLEPVIGTVELICRSCRSLCSRTFTPSIAYRAIFPINQTHSAGDIGDAQSLSSKAAEESRKNGENLELAPAATAGKGHNSNASAGGAAMLGQQEGRDNDTSSSSNNNNIATTNRTTLQRGASSQHVSYGLKRADSPAVLRADADKAFQVSWDSRN